MDAHLVSAATSAGSGAERAAARSCLVCGSKLAASPLAGLLKCGQCDFLTADTEFEAEALARLYGKDYFHGSEYFDYVEERESLRLNFSARMATIESLLGRLVGKSVLEIGCAYGFFLEFARDRGMVPRGVDIAADAVRYARDQLQVDALQGDYLALETQPADLVVMWDTVEHLARPDLFIQRAARDVKPGGMVAITTGDIGSMNARLRGRRWRMIHPPTHLHYFSVETLARLIARNGLEVVHVSHPGVSRRVHAILYMVLMQRLRLPRLYAVLKRLLPNVAVTLNLFDIMFVVAKKGEHRVEGSPSWK